MLKQVQRRTLVWLSAGCATKQAEHIWYQGLWNPLVNSNAEPFFVSVLQWSLTMFWSDCANQLSCFSY